MRARYQLWRDRFESLHPLAWVNLLVLLAAILAFLAIASTVADGDHLALEQRVIESLREGTPPRPVGPFWLANVARDLTALGSLAVLTTTTLLVLGFLCFTRRFGAAIFLGFASAGGHSLNATLKWYYGRERPDPAFHWTHIDSPSFPSGHATASAVVYLTLAVLLARMAENDRHKAYIIGAALVISFIVGLTRVYLGVHYPTDVIAGWLVGIAWAQICWFAARAIGRRRLARAA